MFHKTIQKKKRFILYDVLILFKILHLNYYKKVD
jgi:hypothetical protein